jgi:hypothetical protein
MTMIWPNEFSEAVQWARGAPAVAQANTGKANDLLLQAPACSFGSPSLPRHGIQPRIDILEDEEPLHLLHSLRYRPTVMTRAIDRAESILAYMSMWSARSVFKSPSNAHGEPSTYSRKIRHCNKTTATGRYSSRSDSLASCVRPGLGDEDRTEV